MKPYCLKLNLFERYEVHMRRLKKLLICSPTEDINVTCSSVFQNVETVLIALKKWIRKRSLSSRPKLEPYPKQKQWTDLSMLVAPS